jgi:hypothetical protein
MGGLLSSWLLLRTMSAVSGRIPPKRIDRSTRQVVIVLSNSTWAIMMGRLLSFQIGFHLIKSKMDMGKVYFKDGWSLQIVMCAPS